MQNETIFTKIINREIPSTIIYEDEQCIAFLDINPVTKGHTLVVPKQPFPWIQDIPDEVLGHIMGVAKKIITAMRDTLPCDFVQLSVIGVDVPHAHIHLIPRQHTKQHVFDTHTHTTYESTEEKELFAEKIKRGLR